MKGRGHQQAQADEVNFNNLCVYCLIWLKFEGKVDVIVSYVFVKARKLYVLHVIYKSSWKNKLLICRGGGRGTLQLK